MGLGSSKADPTNEVGPSAGGGLGGLTTGFLKTKVVRNPLVVKATPKARGRLLVKVPSKGWRFPPGNQFARQVLVHRFDPKTGKKIGKSMPKVRVAAAWWGYPAGYKGKASECALTPARANKRTGVWAVRALGKDQKWYVNYRSKGRTGELMYFREG